MRHLKKFFSLAVFLTIWAFCQSEIFAQGCAMCQTSAAGGTKGDGIFKFNMGILIMLTPAVVLFVVMVGTLYRYRDALKMDEPENNRSGEEPLLADQREEEALPSTILPISLEQGSRF